MLLLHIKEQSDNNFVIINFISVPYHYMVEYISMDREQQDQSSTDTLSGMYID